MMAKKRNPTRQYVNTGMYTEQVADGTWQFVIQADGNYRTLCTGTGYNSRRNAWKGMWAVYRRFMYGVPYTFVDDLHKLAYGK